MTKHISRDSNGEIMAAEVHSIHGDIYRNAKRLEQFTYKLGEAQARLFSFLRARASNSQPIISMNGIRQNDNSVPQYTGEVSSMHNFHIPTLASEAGAADWAPFPASEQEQQQ